MSDHAGGLPAAVLAGRGDRGADRPCRGADRGRHPDRRRRPGRARLRDPARSATGGVARDGRAARRRAGRGRGEGAAAGLAPALRGGRQPARAAAALRRSPVGAGHAELRRGQPRGCLPARQGHVDPDPGSADDAKPPQRGSCRRPSSAGFSASRPRLQARTCCRRRPRRSCSWPTAASTASARATKAAGGAASRSATSSRARTSQRRSPCSPRGRRVISPVRRSRTSGSRGGTRRCGRSA